MSDDWLWVHYLLIFSAPVTSDIIKVIQLMVAYNRHESRPVNKYAGLEIKKMW